MQSTNTLLMVEPVAFGYNEQTAVNNYFQTNTQAADTQQKALAEFRAFVRKLEEKGIRVIVVKDTANPHTPDSIYPNNWVSFHEDGRVALYPMFAENRRWERRYDILKELEGKGFQVKDVVDYSDFEKENKFLEGTGAMILDRDHKIAYGAASPRLNPEVFKIWCAEFDYKPVLFHAFQTLNGERLPIYHTNVMMCVGTDLAIVALSTLDVPEERQMLEETLKNSGKTIVDISEDQMNHFAGNMLEVQNAQGQKFLVMSGAAYRSLKPEQIAQIEAHLEIIHADVDVIEKNGGGSVRCMIAEVFLPEDE